MTRTLPHPIIQVLGFFERVLHVQAQHVEFSSPLPV